MNIKEIGVIGAGTMGTGIAQVAATAGFDVLLHDVEEEFLQKRISWSTSERKLPLVISDSFMMRLSQGSV